MSTSYTTSKTAENRFNPENGIRVERRNTIRGVDPYSSFNWVKRDVIMRNWRDDSINFEQRDVEFPENWSENASSIVTSKYFRGAVGTPQRETSLKNVVERVVISYRNSGIEAGYFASMEDADAFADEMRYALVDQQFAFNSPVWFNVGTSSPWQVSACYILRVEDTMGSILDWYKEEGMIFKGGSGAGVNLSNIRSSKEILSSGGAASGPVSFMRGADASAGTIKSGGATRRAAKMVILDVDHPDIEEFVHIKAREEEKIRVLRDAGFDMDLGGKDSVSVQYQNANNSVRVDDKFMQAVKANHSYGLRARKTNEVLEEVNAQGLLEQIAQAAWSCADPGIQYKDTINKWHTLPNEGPITGSNPCSEFLHLDNSSCNLASVKLTKFYNPETRTFDVEGFEYLVRIMMIAAEISVHFGHFPTEKIGEVTRKSRPIGLGYTDLGALLMSVGVGYDSDEGRNLAGAVTSLLSSVAYDTSAELARAVGPFEYFAANKEPMLKVMQMHLDASGEGHSKSLETPWETNVEDIWAQADRYWKSVLQHGEQWGFRNSQAVVLAPTGTISFFMDASTTGVEPDLGLVKSKKIADGGSITIVNNTVPIALKALGYNTTDVEIITQYVRENNTVLGAPNFNEEHANVFACAMGDNVISAQGHLKMMAAVQPFVSGSISKTINLPEEATVEDIYSLYMQGWELGLKCVAVYRDNCKVGQPLSVEKKKKVEETVEAELVELPRPSRIKLPQQRAAVTTSFAVGGADGYITTGNYDQGQLGELFLKLGKQGSTLGGIMDAFAISVSLGLQYGVPLEVYCSKFLNTRFEPAGITNDKDIRMATSVLDYVFRRLALDYLNEETRETLGVASVEERKNKLEDQYGNPSVEEEQASARAVSQNGVSKAELKDRSTVMCMDCGVEMQRAGSCYACPQCSNTTGCS